MATRKRKPEPEPVRYTKIQAKIPAPMWTKFKILCLQQGTTTGQYLEAMIEAVVTRVTGGESGRK